ncbi:MAG: hypothetical protein KC983_01880 [Phycisphaerales bacterium]|nr:hypothetical protein [Phycisphaerales bacterium]
MLCVSMVQAVCMVRGAGAADPPTSQPAAAPTSQPTSQPARGDDAPAFNAEGSDQFAIELADQVMAAMGGQQAWDDTHYLRWTFFGRRTLLWDKFTNTVRIDMNGPDGGPIVLIVNLTTGDGVSFRDGAEIPGDDGQLVRKNAAKMWINDSYWLLMPYKLKDPGVTLRWVRTYVGDDGHPFDVIELTYDKVGATPQNKYHVHIDRARNLVTKWEFFRDANDEAALLSTPWTDWKRYGSILLSSGRGEMSLTDIAVFDDVPATAFTSPEPVDYDAATPAKTEAEAGQTD